MTSDVINEAREKAQDIEEKIQEFFDKVNDVLSWVPSALEHLVDPIVEGVERFRQKVEEFWAKISDYLDMRGNPDKLNRFADEWVEKIGNPVGEVAGDVKLDKMQTNIEWTGRASEAYKAIVPRQSELLQKVQSLAVQISTSLKNLANGIDSFWTAMVLGLAAFLVSIAGAIVSLCGVVTAPVAIGAAITGISALIAAATTAVTEINSIQDTVSSEQDAIVQEAHELGEEWAKSSTDMSNPGDWNPR